LGLIVELMCVDFFKEIVAFEIVEAECLRDLMELLSERMLLKALLQQSDAFIADRCVE
jgi:hypothetical protein